MRLWRAGVYVVDLFWSDILDIFQISGISGIIVDLNTNLCFEKRLNLHKMCNWKTFSSKYDPWISLESTPWRTKNTLLFPRLVGFSKNLIQLLKIWRVQLDFSCFRSSSGGTSQGHVWTLDLMKEYDAFNAFIFYVFSNLKRLPARLHWAVHFFSLWGVVRGKLEATRISWSNTEVWMGLL